MSDDWTPTHLEPNGSLLTSTSDWLTAIAMAIPVTLAESINAA